ncbi:MAG: hypothetical protein HQ568_10810, partial [Calditrichaeota bacterium]|nr:hypothetical protein [Calditrichota bacterium]
RGFACGKNPYLGMYLVDPERDPGPYRVQFGIENPHQSTTLEINGINVWVQWGALFTP